MIELLLSKGANLHDEDRHGYTPLQWACNEGHVSVVELLLSKGANLHEKSPHGFTPLQRASSKGHASVVELLLLQGANASGVDAEPLIPFISYWPLSMLLYGLSAICFDTSYCSEAVAMLSEYFMILQ